jgi:hypothetical protein
VHNGWEGGIGPDGATLKDLRKEEPMRYLGKGILHPEPIAGTLEVTVRIHVELAFYNSKDRCVCAVRTGWEAGTISATGSFMRPEMRSSLHP